MKQLIVGNELVWHKLCRSPYHQRCCYKKVEKCTNVCHFFLFVMQSGKPFRFHTPSSISVVVPSGCGKTVFTEKLLLENADLFETPPTQVHYCYGAW